ncbi:recombinase family protein [Candidatus Pseudoruminococcus sp.]|uniref:recombinase family protein n=1 Tax=Candidatus Pseudoruminococcus sp. TaxID=3101048 RepID=UPI00399B4A48
MIYGYARISKPTQNIDRQIRSIKNYDGTATIFKEAYTGTKQDRPEWIKLNKRLKSGDTVIFDSVSRMSRNAIDGFSEYEVLYQKGINLIFIKEPHINTLTYKNALNQQIAATGNEIADTYIEATNKVLMILAKQQIKLAFEQAQKEVDDLHKRTAEGMQTAKLNGKQIGRKKGTTVVTKKSIKAKKIIQKHSIDFGGSLTDKEVMLMIGKITRNTYYKYKKELKNT